MEEWIRGWAINGDQQSGDRATWHIHDRDLAAAVGDAAAEGREEPPAAVKAQK